MIIYYVITSILAVILGQLAGHLNKKLPPVVAEEISYREFFNTLTKNFKIDYVFSLVFVIIYNGIVFFSGFN